MDDAVTAVLGEAAARCKVHLVGGAVPVFDGDVLRNDCRGFGPDGSWAAAIEAKPEGNSGSRCKAKGER